MKNPLKLAVVLSVILNAYYFAAWTYASQTQVAHADAVTQFDKLILLPHTLVATVLILLSVVSIIFLSRATGLTWKVLLVVQCAALFLLCWQFL